MKFKVYISGLITIVAVFVIIVLSACLVDAKAASSAAQAAGDKASKNESGEIISDGSSDESSAQADESAAADDEAVAVASASQAEQDFTELQETYGALVSRYNKLVKKCNSNSLSNNEEIKNVLNQTADVLTEMGDTDLDTADDADIAELQESADVLNSLLDEMDETIDAYLGTDGTTSDASANYEKPDFTVTTTSGEEFKLSEQSGNVVVVSFFATWCNPCQEEMKVLQKLNKSYKDSDVKIITIGSGETDSSMADYMKENSFDFMAAADESGTISSDYNVSSIPYTIVFGKDGSVIKEFDGLAEKSEYKDAIDSGLK